MTLAHRSEVQNQIRPKIERNEFTCHGEECRCFEALKNDMRFAILSHRWGRDELSFHDLSATTKPPSGASSIQLQQVLNGARLKRGRGLLERLQVAGSTMPSDCGFAKLVKLCEIAIKEGCKFVWMDTVCINKESSAELEESIRSMFGWYRDSDVCIVHLAQTSRSHHMAADQWFTRGWTLQELLAPPRILFFTSHWKRITNLFNDKCVDDIRRGTPPLMITISEITKIPIRDLTQFKPGLYDIQQRMSWASRRETTRVEDMAYCLIGIFGISLSVAYGERENAFYRLQAEILQRSDDRGLFQWKGDASAHNSMLAAGPECFLPIAQEAKIVPHVMRSIGDPTYALTNLGLRIWMRVYRPIDNEVQGALKSLRTPLQMSEDIGILAQTADPGTYLAVVLKIIGNLGVRRYKRVNLIELSFPPFNAPNKEPIEIFIA